MKVLVNLSMVIFLFILEVLPLNQAQEKTSSAPSVPHQDSVFLSAAFVGTSGKCVSLSMSGAVVVWDLADGKQISNISLLPCLSFSVSPSCQQVACGGWEGRIVILDLATGKELRSFAAGDKAAVEIVRWSPDGKHLVSTDKVKVVHLWDVRTGERARSIPIEQPVSCLAFSPDSKSLLLGPSLRGHPGKVEDFSVKLLDLQSGAVRRSFVGPRGGVSCVGFSPDGRLVLGASSDILVWDVASGEIRQRLKGETVYSATFTADSKRVLIAGFGQPIRLVDVASGKEVLRCEPRGVPSWSGAVMSPDGKQILGFVKSLLVLWDAKTGEEILTVTGPPTDRGSPISWLLSCPKAPHLLARDVAAKVFLWDYRKGGIVREFVGERAAIAWAAFTPDGKQLLTSDDNGGRGPFYQIGARLRLWDVGRGKERASFPRDLTFDAPVAVSPDGRVGAVGLPGALELFDLSDWHRIKVLESDPKTRIAHPLFAPDGAHVIAWGGGPVRVWRWKDAQLVCTFPDEYVASAAVSPDSRLVVTGGSRLVISELGTGRSVRILEQDDGNATTAVAFSPDGTLVLSAKIDGTIRLWNVKTGAVVRKLVGKGRNYIPVHAVVFLGDGKLAASGDDDGLIRIWDVETGKELRQLKKK